MNVYDFDDTIFRGDSTRAFWAYCLKRAPGLARFLPRQCAAAVRYALGRTAKEAFKEAFFPFAGRAGRGRLGGGFLAHA